jgi:uncharacterized BrkB/YihY/UPF0761 family membrane protein
MTRWHLGGLLTIGVLAAIPLTVVLGVLSVYVLAAAGLERPTDPPMRLLLVGPLMAALGAAGLAALAGYFWLLAIMVRNWRVSR